MAKNFTVHGGMLFAARETNNTPVGYQSTNNGSSWSPICHYYRLMAANPSSVSGFTETKKIILIK